MLIANANVYKVTQCHRQRLACNLILGCRVTFWKKRSEYLHCCYPCRYRTDNHRSGRNILRATWLPHNQTYSKESGHPASTTCHPLRLPEFTSPSFPDMSPHIPALARRFALSLFLFLFPVGVRVGHNTYKPALTPLRWTTDAAHNTTQFVRRTGPSIAQVNECCSL